MKLGCPIRATGSTWFSNVDDKWMMCDIVIDGHANPVLFAPLASRCVKTYGKKARAENWRPLSDANLEPNKIEGVFPAQFEHDGVSECVDMILSIDESRLSGGFWYGANDVVFFVASFTGTLVVGGLFIDHEFKSLKGELTHCGTNITLKIEAGTTVISLETVTSLTKDGVPIARGLSGHYGVNSVIEGEWDVSPCGAMKVVLKGRQEDEYRGICDFEQWRVFWIGPLQDVVKGSIPDVVFSGKGEVWDHFQDVSFQGRVFRRDWDGPYKPVDVPVTLLKQIA